MSSLTGRYSSSPETRMEQDLSLLRGKASKEDFIHALEQEMRAVLTPDYWEVTLPNELNSASARNTAQLTYYAALCISDVLVLYSNMKVR